MVIIDLFPLRGYFLPRSKAEFELKIEIEQSTDVVIEIQIYNLDKRIFSHKQPYNLHKGKQKIHFDWETPPIPRRGYGCKVWIFDSEMEQLLGSISTAFDVLTQWTDFPRYGFLSDFHVDRPEPLKTLHSLVPFHITGLQFYDWQYRHDQLISPTDLFIDPLDRELALPVIRELIRSAHQYGMAAMPYLAVYAASISFWKEHKCWGMFDKESNAYTFQEFLGLMDPSNGSPWTHHLLNQCTEVERKMDFDGFHIDQYGEPKQAYTINGEEIDLPNSFVAFINQLKTRFTKQSVVLNAVGNWPIEELCNSEQDFIYIEIWPPNISYTDIEEIVINAREKSGGKPVIIAQYLHNDQPNNIRLSNSIIMACGGTRIELGEQARLLANPYFPKHEEISQELIYALRRTSDFMVRYGELIGPEAKNSNSIEVVAPENITVIGRETETHQIINLINMRGLINPNWTETHRAPTKIQNFQINVLSSKKINKVLWASPDSKKLDLLPCNFSTSESKIVINIPILDFWTMIAIEFNNMEV